MYNWFITWFVYSTIGIFPKSLLLLIGTLFITWGFNKSVGILGITIMLAYYWRRHLKVQRAARRDIQVLRESIVTHFEGFNGKKGEEHFDFLYLNAKSILDANNTATVTFMNYLVKAGVIIMCGYSIWISDWISLVVCIIIGGATKLFSSKHLQFHKYTFRTLESGEEAFDELVNSVENYINFLSFKWKQKARNDLSTNN